MDEPKPVTRAEAAAAIRDISSAQQRSRRLYGYQMASPHLILWGIIWVIGYGTSTLPVNQWIWPVGIIIGAVGSYWIARRQNPRTDVQTGSHHGWRYVAAIIAVAAFIAALFAIVQPRTPKEADAIAPLLVALGYGLYGILAAGTRMWVTGLGIGVLTVVGFFWLPQYYYVLMAVAGGGGLILGGIWLRST